MIQIKCPLLSNEQDKFEKLLQLEDFEKKIIKIL
jgi:hypothetical protein